MIINQRQANVTQRKLAQIDEAVRLSTGWELETYRGLQSELRHELQEYRAIKGGMIREFRVGCLDDLPELLVKARLAKRWTQRELAAKLGVSEQMVQSDEAGGYERAALWRLADVADALGYEFLGSFAPANHPDSYEETGMESKVSMAFEGESNSTAARTSARGSQFVLAPQAERCNR